MSNKGSDKNVGSIEDVKEHKINLSQKQSIELLKDTLNKFEIRGEQLYLLKLAIKNLLAEREQDKKRIQELEEERDHWHGCFIVAMENSIAKEKVINLVENETIDISGFECIAVEDLKKILEDK